MSRLATGCWRRILSQYQKPGTFSTSSGLFRNEQITVRPSSRLARQMASSTTASSSSSSSNSSRLLSAEFMPIYTLMGLCAAAVILAGLTVANQLVNTPNVAVSKKKRQTLPEMENPDSALYNTERMHNTSFLRKVAGTTERHQELSQHIP